MSLKEYVIETFEKVADLTDERLAYLNRMLDRINASRYTKQQLCEELGFDDIGIFTLLAFLADEKYMEQLEEFGKKFNTEETQRLLS